MSRYGLAIRTGEKSYMLCLEHDSGIWSAAPISAVCLALARR